MQKVEQKTRELHINKHTETIIIIIKVFASTCRKHIWKCHMTEYLWKQMRKSTNENPLATQLWYKSAEHGNLMLSKLLGLNLLLIPLCTLNNNPSEFFLFEDFFEGGGGRYLSIKWKQERIYYPATAWFNISDTPKRMDFLIKIRFRFKKKDIMHSDFINSYSWSLTNFWAVSIVKKWFFFLHLLRWVWWVED